MGLTLLLTLSPIPVAFAQPEATTDGPPPPHLRPVVACPFDFQTLVMVLLRDLPTYANLVASRSLGRLDQQELPFGSVLVVGDPDFTPIDLTTRSPHPDVPTVSDEQTHQVFFTTLERHYLNHQPVLLQNYNWLFLTPSSDGWQLVLMYSSVGGYPATAAPPSPPQESSNGIVGQAVRLWLRDCRAGAVSLDDADTGP